MLRSIRRNLFVNKIVRNLIWLFGRIPSKIYTRLSNKWIVYGTIGSTFNHAKFKYYSNGDDSFADIFFYKKKYAETADLELFMILARYSKIIIDIGANTGLYSILSSKENPQAKIYAIEPYKPNYQRLDKNIKLNEITNVVTRQVAMGSETGTLDISVPVNNSISDVVSADKAFSKEMHPELEWERITVPQYTLDGFVSEINGKIDLIKCDVETHETEVFKGATNVLKQKPVILFEIFLDDTKRVFFNALILENNYYAYLVVKDGITRLDGGFKNNNYEGLNFLLSPIKSSKSFLSFKDIMDNPGEILFHPFAGDKMSA
jgi:FkbM family methyltransferase